MNWFGEKIGSRKASTSGTAGGVGKYLAAPAAAVKTPAQVVPVVRSGEDIQKKKRKMGFGDFDSW